MRYLTANAFRTALEERLRHTAIQQGQTALTRQRKLVVFDRLLARLLIVAPDRWVVKGGLALDLRLGERARTTRDLDLAHQDSESAATADLSAAQSVDLGDFFTFTVERTARLEEAFEGAAVRYRVRADLDGRRFEDLIVDIGFDDPIVAKPDRLRGPDLLSFAEIPPIEVPALPLEQHVAEKLHAYTRTYGAGTGARESRISSILSSSALPPRSRPDVSDRYSKPRSMHAEPMMYRTGCRSRREPGPHRIDRWPSKQDSTATTPSDINSPQRFSIRFSMAPPGTTLPGIRRVVIGRVLARSPNVICTNLPTSH